MTTDHTTPDDGEAELALGFLAVSPEDKILLMAAVHRLANDSLGEANGARVAELTDDDLRGIAFLFDLSLDSLVLMRAKARENKLDASA